MNVEIFIYWVNGHLNDFRWWQWWCSCDVVEMRFTVQILNEMILDDELDVSYEKYYLNYM